MKILHLTEFYAGVGGLERGLHMICETLEAAGHVSSVAFASLRGGEPHAARATYHVPGLAGAGTPEALAEFKVVLDKERPDVVAIHELLEPDILDWVTVRYPSIRYVWGFKLICPGGRRLWQETGAVCPRRVGYMCQAVAYRERCMPRDPLMGLPLIARTLKLATIHRDRSDIVVPSEFMRRLMLNEGFVAGRVHKIPLSTSFPQLESLQTSREPYTILCAARLTPEKGVHFLLEAIKDLPHARLIVAGAGPERARLETVAGEYGLHGRVTFAGWLEPKAVASYIDQAGLVVVPSVWPEPFGLVGIEAMAHARPVIAFDVGGVREWLIPDQTGLLVPPGDVSGLASAIGCLLKDPQRGKLLGEQGRTLAVERFSPARYLRDFLDVGTAVVRRSAKPCDILPT
jgi:glycosyltransferase involved in cell wall biosynthesis